MNGVLQKPLLLWLGLAIGFAAQAAFRFNSALNHDVAWYIYVARGLIEGKTLYVDFVEVNPPLGIWLLVPVVWLGQAAGIDAVPLLYGLILALTFGVIVLLRRYLRAWPSLGAAGGNFALLLIAFVLLFVPGRNFAQREHLMVLCFVPWLFLRAARAHGFVPSSIESIAAGAAAALGVCFKAHGILAPIAVELALLLVHRQWRAVLATENFSAAAVAALYGAAVYLFAPAFYGEMIELGIRAYMPFYGVGAYWIFVGSLQTALSILLALILLAMGATACRELTVAGAGAAIGVLLSFYVQAKGYSYQILPAQMLACIAAASAFATVCAASPVNSRTAFAATAVMVVVLVMNVYDQTYRHRGAPFEKAMAAYAPQAKSVFIASTNVYSGFPLVLRHDLTWASRYPALWLTPYVATVSRLGEMPADPIAAKALHDTVSDLTTFRPDVVFIDVSKEQTYVPGESFDYLGFWSADPRFAGLWADYEFRGAEADFAVYTRKNP